MSYDCDPALLRLMLERGHTADVHGKTRTDDGMGGYVLVRSARVADLPVFVTTLSAEEREKLARIGVVASHLVFAPVSNAAGTPLNVIADEELVLKTPSDLANKRFYIHSVVTFPQGAIGGTAGRHLEIACSEIVS